MRSMGPPLIPFNRGSHAEAKCRRGILIFPCQLFPQRVLRVCRRTGGPRGGPLRRPSRRPSVPRRSIAEAVAVPGEKTRALDMSRVMNDETCISASLMNRTKQAHHSREVSWQLVFRSHKKQPRQSRGRRFVQSLSDDCGMKTFVRREPEEFPPGAAPVRQPSSGRAD